MIISVAPRLKLARPVRPAAQRRPHPVVSMADKIDVTIYGPVETSTSYDSLVLPDGVVNHEAMLGIENESQQQGRRRSRSPRQVTQEGRVQIHAGQTKAASPNDPLVNTAISPPTAVPCIQHQVEASAITLTAPQQRSKLPGAPGVRADEMLTSQVFAWRFRAQIPEPLKPIFQDLSKDIRPHGNSDVYYTATFKIESVRRSGA